MNLHYHIVQFLLIIGIVISSVSKSAAKDKTEDTVYEEHLSIHLGRSNFIAGEFIFFKTYGFSNLENPTNFLSKVIYIELIDEQKRSILSQVLHVEDNTASSVLHLPDTLSAGIYSLKGYTNWMKNFGEDQFCSKFLYIYNQHDKQKTEKLLKLEVPFLPEVYLQQGQLIAQIPIRLIIRNPTFSGNYSGNILERATGKKVSTFVSNSEGLTGVLFTPRAGQHYICQLGDSLNGFKNIILPAVNFSGYAVFPKHIEQEEIGVTVYRSNLPQEKIKLVISTASEIISERWIDRMQDSIELVIPIPKTLTGIINISLFNSDNNKLTSQVLKINYPSNNQENLKVFPTRSKVHIKLDKADIDLSAVSELSVSVHKKIFFNDDSLTTPDQNPIGFSYFEMKYNGGILLPRCWNIKTVSSIFKEKYWRDFIYSVEDMGLLYTGKLLNPEEFLPTREVDVVLAIKDTSTTIIAGHTDIEGKFSLLTNLWRNQEGYFTLYSNGILLGGEQQITVDSKYFYQENYSSGSINIEQFTDDYFQNEMKEEAQRVLIQRAYSRNGTDLDYELSDTTNIPSPFYGEPSIVVIPDDFLYLPNFEEISREILPRVRYRHKETNCELIINHVEDYIQSKNPLVLIDGLPILNYCDLYSLDSDDIQRIEVQSGLRVSGNLPYNGLLAIFTTPKYKEENKKIKPRNFFPVLGYANADTLFSIQKEKLMDARTPDFKNQLYWNPSLIVGKNGVAEFEFFSSEEEGLFTIDILGYTDTGLPLSLRKYISIKADK